MQSTLLNISDFCSFFFSGKKLEELEIILAKRIVSIYLKTFLCVTPILEECQSG